MNKKAHSLKIAAILAVFVFYISNILAQPCLPQGIHFDTQIEIDSFQYNHPFCTEIEGSVTISGEDIENLNGLNVLTDIGGDLLIGNSGRPGRPCNPLLFDLAGLENLASIEGNLIIGWNKVLQNLTGLDGLIEIGGEMKVLLNFNLKNLNGLESIYSIGEDLSIKDNSDLNSLSGLETLIIIDGELRIINNDSLQSLSGLDNLYESAWYGLIIAGNEMLSECETQSVCNYLAGPSGFVAIDGNNTGCNSHSEVEEACGIVKIDEVPMEGSFSIYPNPASSKFILALQPGIKVTSAEITCLQGNIVMKQEVSNDNSEINISHLPIGLYFIRLHTNKGIEVKKLIIL